MKSRRTSSSFGQGQPTIVIEYDDAADESTVSSVIAGLEVRAIQGSEFKPGQTLQLGCNVLRFEQEDQNELVLSEPDYHSFPISFQRGASSTIAQLARQADVSHSLPERLYQKAECPSILQSAVLCSKFGDPGSGYLLKRYQADGNDSGWFMGCLAQHDHKSNANLKRESVYRALLACPDLADFLWLPAGCAVQYVPGKTLVIFDENSDAIKVPANAPLRRNYPYAA